MNRRQRLNALAFVGRLEPIAATLRKLGLHSLTRAGRHLLGLVLGNHLAVEVNGLRMAGAIEHRGHLQLIRRGRYEAFTTELFRHVLREGMTVLDIGAHLGYYSLLAGQVVTRRGKVFAFEPDPRTFPLLVQNIQRNGLGETVLPAALAISDRAGMMSFFLDRTTPAASSLFRPVPDMRTTEVRSETVDECLPGGCVPGVIKMDIEGGELRALAGMEATMRRAGEGLILFVECNPKALRSAGGSAHELVNRLSGLGFETAVIDERNHQLSSVGPGLESVKSVNLYCTRTKAAGA